MGLGAHYKLWGVAGTSGYSTPERTIARSKPPHLPVSLDLKRQALQKLHQVIDLGRRQVARAAVAVRFVVVDQDLLESASLPVVEVRGRPVDANQGRRIVARRHFLAWIVLARANVVQPERF